MSVAAGDFFCPSKKAQRAEARAHLKDAKLRLLRDLKFAEQHENACVLERERERQLRRKGGAGSAIALTKQRGDVFTLLYYLARGLWLPPTAQAARFLEVLAGELEMKTLRLRNGYEMAKLLGITRELKESMGLVHIGAIDWTPEQVKQAGRQQQDANRKAKRAARVKKATQNAVAEFLGVSLSTIEHLRPKADRLALQEALTNQPGPANFAETERLAASLGIGRKTPETGPISVCGFSAADKPGQHRDHAGRAHAPLHLDRQAFVHSSVTVRHLSF